VTHTAWPWEAFFETGRKTGIVIDAHGVEVGGEGNYTEDDAFLISAAPELLAALEDCVGRFVTAFPAAEEYEPIKKAKDAIAKARGTSSS